MANAMVDKLKNVGIRHGEKAVVAIVDALCLLFLVRAVTKPTIPLTTDIVKNHVSQAAQNLDRPQKEEDILSKLEQEGVKDSTFAKTVDSQAVVAIDAAKFALKNPWVTPEPGAGLIRDTPTLIAARELYARAGRGGALVYELDPTGKRVVDLAKTDPSKQQPNRGRPIRRGGGGMGRGMMMPEDRDPTAGILGSRNAPASPEAEAARKKEQEKKARLLRESLVGNVAAPKEDPNKKAAEQPGVEQKWKEVTRGLRWVALVATLDNKKLRENYAAALKLDYGSAHPNYQRIDAERQELQADGSWSDWQLVNRDENQKVLTNIPEADAELTPDEVRLETISDMLPFLRAGYWKGVHVAALVPQEKRELPKEQPAQFGGGGRFSRYQMPDMDRPEADLPNRDFGAGYGVGFGGGGPENTNFPKTEAEQVMIRTLDFTAEPDTTYRFRIRIVVLNPNREREDVSPGVDNKSKELFGPWSDPSGEVTVPADVTAYVMRKNVGGENARGDQVHFQLARWTPDDGLTAYKYFDAGPGQLLGEPTNTKVPIYDDTTSEQATRPKQVDYNTHQMVLDVGGGMLRPPRLEGMSGSTFDDPATALMLRPDGRMVLRDEAVDTRNTEMAEMKEIYDRAIKEAEDSKKPARGAGRGF